MFLSFSLHQNHTLTAPIDSFFKADTLFQLILDCPRKVQAMAFAPQNGDILVAGLANGQIAIYDLKGRIERVEQEIKLTPDQVKYHAAMVCIELFPSNA